MNRYFKTGNKLLFLLLWVSLLFCHYAFGQVKDFEGNIYKTHVFGDLEWMVENLRSKKFSSGDSIILVKNPGIWSELNSAAYTLPNSTNESRNQNGFLYNGYAALEIKGICPTNWRLPSHSEWSALILSFGGEKEAGMNLMNKNTDNSLPSYFNVQLSGFIGSDGFLGGFGQSGYWWSSTVSHTQGLWGRFIQNGEAGMYMVDGFKNSGFSIRCVREINP